MGVKIGVAGVGAFAQSFIPLFKVHPLVDEVTLCDLDADKLTKNSIQHGIPKTSPSLDHLLTTDIDAAVIITQNWMHGPQALQAIKAGKHVYSAVPMGVSVDEIKDLVAAVEATGQIYMMGETSYYYPETVYCRERYKEGAFGQIVYGEAEYYHDWDHGLYDVAKWRGGERWLESAGSPPMYYPTHSVSMIVSVTGAYMKQVACFGFPDKKDPHIYGDSNMWKNKFSNQTALFAMSDGSCARVNEFRRVGHTGTVRMALFGTEGSFEHNTAGAAWVTKSKSENVDDLLTCALSRDIGADVSGNGGAYARVHDSGRLPAAFKNMHNGHLGSHHFLVDDFVKACFYKKHPPVNVWQSARYTIPGVVAHESSLKGGVLLDVPDLGEPEGI